MVQTCREGQNADAISGPTLITVEESEEGPTEVVEQDQLSQLRQRGRGAPQVASERELLH